MEGRLVDDPNEFFDSLVQLVGDREARHNLIFGIAGSVVADPDAYETTYFWLVEDAGKPVGAALMTPPWHLVVADERVPGAAEVIAEAVQRSAVPIPGANGNRPTIERFVAAWTRLQDCEIELAMAQGVFSLEAVREVPRSPGQPRAASEDDRDLLVGWIRAFESEAFATPQPGQTEDLVDRFLRQSRAAAGLWVWEDVGEPVCLSGYGRRTPSGIRIGPVFTPPGHRGRGYATSLVAEQSRWLLDQGHRFCFLYTDLANPTANAIYERIGYEQVAESAMYRFVN